VMGTPMYMSPEQAQGLAVDARSDVWSLASVLYEALAGRTAYDARDTYEQMIVQIVTQKPKPIEQIAPWVPAPIARVIEGALVHDVADRTPDAVTFAKKLAEASRMPPSKSDPDLAAAAGAPPSVSEPRAFAPTVAASPPTGTGVVVRARTAGDPATTRKRGPMTWLALGGAGVVALVVVGVMTRNATHATDSSGHGGLVAAPAEPSASTTAAAATSGAAGSVTSAAPGEPPTKLLPAEPTATVAAAAPSAAPTAIKAIAATAAADAGARTTTRPASGGAATAPATTKTGTTQYGAAGVSTAY